MTIRPLHRSAIAAVILLIATATQPALAPAGAQGAGCERIRAGAWSGVPLPPQTPTETDLLAVDPTDADRLLVNGGGGIFFSSDGGCTWTPSDADLRLLPDRSRSLDSIAFSPDGRVVLARVDSTAGGDQIYRSDDGGASFAQGPTLSPLPVLTLSSGGSNLVFGGPDGATVYTLSNGGFEEPLLEVSTDGGTTFQSRTIPASASGINEARVIADPHSPQEVWLKYTEGSGMIHRSQDAGQTWTGIEVPLTPGQHISYGDDGLVVGAIGDDARRLTVVEEYDDDAASTTQAFRYVSDDDGLTWTTEFLPTPPLTVYDHVVGDTPDVELVVARNFYPGTTPGTKALLRRGTGEWVDVSLPALGHLEQVQRSTDPTTGKTTALALGTPGEGSYGGDEGQAVVWRFEESLEAAPHGGAAPGAPAVSRLSGAERIATGIAVSADVHGAGEAGSVVVARADAFPDALAGSPLAATLGGPLLLTQSSRLTDATATELRRVLPAGGTVRLLGGEAALSAQVQTDVEALGYTVDRLAGPTRFDTAVQIAEATSADPEVILVADGATFPDALIAGASAGLADGVVVLTDGTRLPDVTRTYLDAHADTPVIAVGQAAQAAVPDAEPLGGDDAAATAVAAAQRFTTAPARVALASAAAFPDGLTGGAHAATTDTPLLLVDPAGLTDPTTGYLRAVAPLEEIVVYGGPAAISDAVVEAARTSASSRSPR